MDAVRRADKRGGVAEIASFKDLGRVIDSDNESSSGDDDERAAKRSTWARVRALPSGFWRAAKARETASAPEPTAEPSPPTPSPPKPKPSVPPRNAPRPMSLIARSNDPTFDDSDNITDDDDDDSADLAWASRFTLEEDLDAIDEAVSPADGASAHERKADSTCGARHSPQHGSRAAHRASAAVRREIDSSPVEPPPPRARAASTMASSSSSSSSGATSTAMIVAPAPPDVYDLPTDGARPWAPNAAQRNFGRGSTWARTGRHKLSYEALLAAAFCGDVLGTLCNKVGLRRFHVFAMVCTAWHDAVRQKLREWGVLTYADRPWPPMAIVLGRRLPCDCVPLLLLDAVQICKGHWPWLRQASWSI